MQNHISRVLGGLLILVGISVFLIRLHHAGPYAMPGGGNLIAGVLALALGISLVAPWVTMPGSKSDNHGLEEGPVEMLRGGLIPARKEQIF